MIEFSIHLPSIFIGFILGYVVIAAIFLFIDFSERWHNGFSIGWEAGRKYAEDKMKEKEGKTDEQTD